MDYQKLIEPYAEGGLRTPEGQIAWLRKKGFSPVVIANAMEAVYDRLEKGETFPDGHELDVELLRNAERLHLEEGKLLMDQLLTKRVEGGRFKKAWMALTGKL